MGSFGDILNVRFRDDFRLNGVHLTTHRRFLPT